MAKTTFDKVRMSSLEVEKPLTVRGETVFDEVLTAEFTPLIELDSSNGLSTVYRDKTSVTNSGAVTNSNGEHKVSTGATASSTAQLDTRERGRYQPGIVGLAGCAIRRPTAPTGNQEIRWGYYDDEDGVFFGEDATGLFVRIESGNTAQSKVYQSDWNVDTLDGSGGSKNPSGLTLDLTAYNVYRIHYAWYGGGPAEMRVMLVDPDDDNAGDEITVHRFNSQTGELLFHQPKLPIRIEADNGGDAKTIDIYVGGRQYAVLGRYKPNVRVTSQENLGVSTVDTGFTPIVSMKKKTDRTNQGKSVKLHSTHVVSSGDHVWAVFLGPTLNGDSFTDVDDVAATETAMQMDVSATGFTDLGTAIEKGLVSGGQGSATRLSESESLDLDLPDNTNITLAAKSASGASSVSGILEIKEEW